MARLKNLQLSLSIFALMLLLVMSACAQSQGDALRTNQEAGQGQRNDAVPARSDGIEAGYSGYAAAATSGGGNEARTSQHTAVADNDDGDVPAGAASPSASPLPPTLTNELNGASDEPVILFELTKEMMSKPVDEIPYYSFGEITFVAQETIQGFAEGHYPWRGDPFQAATILTQNLIPAELSPDQVSYSLVHVENELQPDELTIVDMSIPGQGVYSINVQVPSQSGGICYITKIEWQPASSYRYSD